MGVAVAAGLVLLLAGFAVLQAVQLRRITRERDRANRVTDFLMSMFKVSDPSEAGKQHYGSGNPETRRPRTSTQASQKTLSSRRR